VDKGKLRPTKSLPLDLTTMQMSSDKRGFVQMKKSQTAGLCTLIFACTFYSTSCAWEAKASRPVPLKLALEIVERDLRDATPVTLSDLGSERRDKVYDVIFYAQCASQTPNPLIPVVTGPISLALQGSIQQAGALAGTASMTPSLGLTYTVTQGQQQQLTVPITFVSVQGLPNFYMGQNLANLSNLDKSDKGRDKLIQAILDKQAALSAFVTAAMGQYPKVASRCPTQPGYVPPVAPIFPQEVIN